jgi:hypothetical protein
LTFRTKAHGFIRRAVVTCANNEVHNRRISEHKRVALEERLAAAERRKEELMLCGISMAGGGPSPTRPRSAARVTSPALSESQALALRVDGVSLTPPNDRRARPASAIGVMNTTHVMNAVHARPVTARGLTLSDAHDSVTSEDDLSESGVVVFRTPEQTSPARVQGGRLHGRRVDRVDARVRARLPHRILRLNDGTRETNER